MSDDIHKRVIKEIVAGLQVHHGYVSPEWSIILLPILRREYGECCTNCGRPMIAQNAQCNCDTNDDAEHESVDERLETKLKTAMAQNRQQDEALRHIRRVIEKALIAPKGS